MGVDANKTTAYISHVIKASSPPPTASHACALGTLLPPTQSLQDADLVYIVTKRSKAEEFAFKLKGLQVFWL